MIEIRTKTGFYGIDLVCDSDGWYLCAGTYGDKSFDLEPTAQEIANFAEELREEAHV